MKISNQPPPNWEELEAAFGVEFGKVCVTWGDTCHMKGELSEDLEAHETVHSIQQAAVGGPRAWFDRYMADPRFRYEQELEAYRAQARKIAAMVPNREKAMRHIHRLSCDLSGPMYGGIVTQAEALKAIRQ